VTSTKDRLVLAAASLLDEGGPEAVTLREVGRLAGVSHNAPYKHFADKESLLAAVAARELRSLAGRVDRACRSAASERAAIEAAAVAYARWALAHPVRFKLAFVRWGLDDPGLGEAATLARSAFFRPFLEAARAGVIALHPARAATIVWASVHGAVDLHLSGHLAKDGSTATPGDVAADIVALLTA
jgi:AcrR family transcriptional regulator